MILRLYETDIEKQTQVMEELLCREILGITPNELRRKKSLGSYEDVSPRSGTRLAFVRMLSKLKNYFEQE